MEGKNYLSSETLTSIFRTSPKDKSRIINREGITMEFKESLITMEVWLNILKQWLLLLIILQDIYFLVLVIDLLSS